MLVLFAVMNLRPRNVLKDLIVEAPLKVFIPLFISAIVGSIALLLLRQQEWFSRAKSRELSCDFSGLLERLEALRERALFVEQQVIVARDMKKAERFESWLGLYETLLKVMIDTDELQLRPDQIRLAFYLTEQCEQKLAALDADLSVGALPKKTGAPLRSVPDLDFRGCYFCSRPFRGFNLKQARVKLDGKVREVISCETCVNDLRSRKKVKILFFLIDDKPVHWSKYSAYDPVRHFREPGENVSDQVGSGTMLRKSHLTLVESELED